MKIITTLLIVLFASVANAESFKIRPVTGLQFRPVLKVEIVPRHSLQFGSQPIPVTIDTSLFSTAQPVEIVSPNSLHFGSQPLKVYIDQCRFC